MDGQTDRWTNEFYFAKGGGQLSHFMHIGTSDATSVTSSIFKNPYNCVEGAAKIKHIKF